MGRSRLWLVSGAVLAGLAVALGAYAAHGLDRVLAKVYLPSDMRLVSGMSVPATWKYQQDFKTGAEYQLAHALALLIVGVLSRNDSRRLLSVAGWSFLGGIGLFSGSLYLLATTGVRMLGAITPFGGILFLIGWTSLAITTFQSRPVTP